MKLEDINAFVAVVRHESVTGAAEALLTRQPRISRRVQNLERDLGVDLLDRQTKPPRPTPIGRRVFERCEAVLREVASIAHVVRGEPVAADSMRIGVAEVIAEIALLDTMPFMMEEAPGLSIEIASGWSTEMIAQLENDEVDGAIVVLPGDVKFSRKLSATRIDELRMVVVGRKGVVPAGRLNLTDLGRMNWVLNPEGCGFREGLHHALRDRGMSLQVAIGAFGTEQKLGLVAQGVGLGFVPACMLASSRYRDALQPVELEDFSPRPCIWRVVSAQPATVHDHLARFGEGVKRALQTLDAPATATARPQRAPARRRADPSSRA